MIVNVLNCIWLDTYHHPASAREIDKLFGNKLDFEYVKFLVKITDICKIVRKNRISIRVFSYESKVKYPSYVSKKCFEEKNIDLLLIRRKRKALCSY